MYPCSRIILLVLAVMVTAMGLPVQAQTNGTLNTLMKQRDAAIRQLQTTADSQKADLFDKYAGALDTLVKQFTAKGDLDSLVIVRNEIESARTKRAVSAGVLPALDNYRDTLRKNLAVIEGTIVKSQAPIDAAYVRSLTQLKIDLTKAGQVDDALAVDKEIKNLGAGTAPTASAAAPTAVAAAPVGTAAKGIDWEKPIIGEVTLAAANYRPRDRVQVGGEDGPDKKITGGTVHIVPGTQFEDATVFIRFGLVSAERSLFKECNFSADLGGAFQAKDSLLSECTFKKGGAWGAGGFNSKWSFENCAFVRSFAPDWSTTHMGTKLTRCTFHDIEFSGITYRKDAGLDVAQAWCAIHHCRFVGCVIPESLLLATKDCVFEDCRFPVSKTKSPIATPIKVRAYVTDPAAVPPAPALCSYELLDAKLASKEIGADLRYLKNGRTLKFQ